ncbi:MAG TPA: hypothetical protein VIE88_13220 [Vicinamibacteria bacterium]
MRKALLVAMLFGAACEAAADEKATAIADDMMKALGGQEHWDRARFIRFTFVRQGRRLNLTWDRDTGRYRLEAMNDAGVPYVVVMNLHTRQGRAAVEGRPLDGQELSEYLNLANRVWTGETYWLLAPYKLRDPGAILTYEGEESAGGVVQDRLHLRFENVGLTPGDQFWLYVNRNTHLLDRWRFKLQGGTEGDFRWTSWERFGGILLATERVSATGERILFEDIIVTDSLPDEVFTSLAPLNP